MKVCKKFFSSKLQTFLNICNICYGTHKNFILIVLSKFFLEILNINASGYILNNVIYFFAIYSNLSLPSIFKIFY